MKLSFVIPCWNDAARLGGALETLANLEAVPELIVADASDEREPVQRLATKFGAQYVEVAKPCRGGQLNAGAALGSEDVLVFHHADTNFSQAHYDEIVAAMAGGDYVGGAFYKDIRAHHPKVGWCEPAVRWYSRYIGVLYGDQSVFVRRSHFEKMGGFREIPLMEDVEFSKCERRTETDWSP